MEPNDPVPQQPSRPTPAPEEQDAAPPPEADAPICEIKHYARGDAALFAHVPIDGRPPLFIASGTVRDIVMGKPCQQDFQVVVKGTNVEEAFQNLAGALAEAAPKALEHLQKEVTRQVLQTSPKIGEFRLNRDGRGRDNGGRKRRF